MTSRDFCYWLQGYFELGGKLDGSQEAAIKAHLAMVFAHEIDPSAGSPEHQDALQKLHDTVVEQDKRLDQFKAELARPRPSLERLKLRC
jgi:hypothetical protein